MSLGGTHYFFNGHSTLKNETTTLIQMAGTNRRAIQRCIPERRHQLHRCKPTILQLPFLFHLVALLVTLAFIHCLLFKFTAIWSHIIHIYKKYYRQ